MTPTQRLANILNMLFHLYNKNHGDYQPPNCVTLHLECLYLLDKDIQWMDHNNQARRAVSMCLIFAAKRGLVGKYVDIRNIYWQKWTQKFQPEMQDITLFEDYNNRVGSIMEAMTQQAITEQRALMFALVA